MGQIFVRPTVQWKLQSGQLQLKSCIPMAEEYGQATIVDIIRLLNSVQDTIQFALNLIEIFNKFKSQNSVQIEIIRYFQEQIQAKMMDINKAKNQDDIKKYYTEIVNKFKTSRYRLKELQPTKGNIGLLFYFYLIFLGARKFIVDDRDLQDNMNFLEEQMTQKRLGMIWLKVRGPNLVIACDDMQGYEQMTQNLKNYKPYQDAVRNQYKVIFQNMRMAK